MATVELTLEQILDAARQLPAEHRRRLVEEVQRLPSADRASERARRLRGTCRMGPRERKRMSELLARSNEGTLSRTESDELNSLVEQFETKTLEMARALAARDDSPCPNSRKGRER